MSDRPEMVQTEPDVFDEILAEMLASQQVCAEVSGPVNGQLVHDACEIMIASFMERFEPVVDSDNVASMIPEKVKMCLRNHPGVDEDDIEVETMVVGEDMNDEDLKQIIRQQFPDDIAEDMIDKLL